MKEEEVLQLRNWFYRELSREGWDHGDQAVHPAAAEPNPEPSVLDRWRRWMELVDR